MDIPVTFNGLETIKPEFLNLLDFLKSEGIYADKGIAVALNETVVPRHQWTEIIIKANDTIIVIKATQGG